MLVVERLAASYGPAQVLFDVTFAIGAGEVVTLLGRNGMGKTTTIRTIMGLVPARDGAASFDGRALIGLAPFVIAQAGLGLVPEGRQIFPTLTVEENLVATAAARFGAPQWTLPTVYALFQCTRSTGQCTIQEGPRMQLGEYFPGIVFPSLAKCWEHMRSIHMPPDRNTGRYNLGPYLWYECLSHHVDSWQRPE